MLNGSIEERRAFQKQFFWSKFFLVAGIGALCTIFLGAFAFVVGGLVGWPIARLWSAHLAEKAQRTVLNLELELVRRATAGDSCYYYVDGMNSPCAIAANPVSQTLTVVNWAGALNSQRIANPTDDCFKVTSVLASDLKEWRAFEPEVLMQKPAGSLAGMKTADMVAMQRHNSAARKHQRDATGLTITTQRLDLPPIFVNCSFAVGERWVQLLEQFAAGTLHVPEKATLFPKL